MQFEFWRWGFWFAFPAKFYRFGDTYAVGRWGWSVGRDMPMMFSERVGARKVYRWGRWSARRVFR